MKLYDRPQNLFVAGLIGSPSMNFVKGRIDGGKLIDGHGVGWSLAGMPAIASGREVTIGIRPEHVRIENAGLKANVHVVEPTGSETQVVVDLGGTLLTCVFRERVAAKPGEEIGIGFDAQALHLFDSAGGQRLNRWLCRDRLREGSFGFMPMTTLWWPSIMWWRAIGVSAHFGRTAIRASRQVPLANALVPRVDAKGTVWESRDDCDAISIVKCWRSSHRRRE